MALKIRDLREPPLLSPPPGERLRNQRLTGEDEKIISASLASCRALGDSQKALDLQGFMLKLGMKTAVRSKDEWKVKMQDLPTHIADDNPFMVEENCRALAQLGVKFEVNDACKKLLDKDLKSVWAQRGAVPARVHHLMATLGLKPGPAEQERKSMRDRLASLRVEGSGFSVIAMHYYMREMGIDTDLTEDDKKSMATALSRARKDRNGLDLAMIHVFMARLIDEKPPESSRAPMPPLKRFKG